MLYASTYSTLLQVILGGGRRELIPNTTIDEEGYRGNRQDQRNLIKEWETQKAALKRPYEYVWNRDQLRTVSGDTEYLMGLFESDHCKYHLEVNDDMEPTFEEMVEAAINVLSKDKNGFFLFAEGMSKAYINMKQLKKLALANIQPASFLNRTMIYVLLLNSLNNDLEIFCPRKFAIKFLTPCNKENNKIKFIIVQKTSCYVLFFYECGSYTLQ